MNKAFVFLCFITLLGSFACSEDRIFEEFQPLTNQSWGIEDSLTFDLSKIEPMGHPSLIAFRFNEEYTFSNCYVRVLSKDSLGVIIENKLINVPLFDSKTGEPQGDGFGSTYTFYDTLPFQFQAGTKSVTLLQYMRQNQLPGIESVGLKILK
ncbi:gliding motility-associated lipoprotein GldH [Algoriphagus iocasae]|uniref:Gliding motility-associated lipoprotein GldH n=1 Tax=Algoriphagus iocasae TaxID=1836499 RepID=A0A841MS12_9BACT|nr:gliding motility lipoprotein GldH [Algoriphagus iocasae]MBB6327454.1 gliding motility-associated lipoprotein GldH [Algoriphagus iocasae]